MLHINLLPPYIYEGKRKKQLIAVWSLVAAATVGLFLFALTGLNATHEEEKEKETIANTLKLEHDALVTQIGGVKTQIAETKQKQDFIASSQIYNDSWGEGFLQVRDVTNPRIVLNAVSFDPSRGAVNINAFAPSELDAIKWWMVLLNQTDKFTNVNITLPSHGYQPGGGTVTGAAPGGMGGGGSMGGGAGPRATGMTSMGGGGSMGSMMGGRTGGMGGGAASAAGSESELEGRAGFDFVCTAGLVNPLKGGAVAPSWAGTNAGGAAPGGFGGGSMMGGSMGGMGGSMGGMGGSMGGMGGSRGAGMAPQ